MEILLAVLLTVGSQPARMRCGKVQKDFLRADILCRNPRECAVAKNEHYINPALTNGRNPRECAVAKCAALSTTRAQISRNPRECAVAKIAQYRQHTQ